MSGDVESLVLELLNGRRQALLEAWISSQEAAAGSGWSTASDPDFVRQSTELLDALAAAVEADGFTVTAPGYKEVHRLLAELSGTHVRLGHTPSETAAAVFSLKDAIVATLGSDGGPDGVEDGQLGGVDRLVQGLGLITFDAYVRGREQVIRNQHEELLELSTPVVELWEGILALPLIGTLDSQRTQMVMENLLSSIVEHEARIAILDITGVPTVDTLVAQHLLKTVAAARLMGAECIISGIRPHIAQTIVSLGVELGEVITKPSMAGALQVALRRLGYTVRHAEPAS
ncbi:MAG: STAS domain-containing protein [Acidimicrobiales bacterium]